MSSVPHTTDCGLPGIKDIPYGVHMCHFYETREQLAAMLVPYFAAGLRNNERCIWITADPLNVEDAQLALRNAGVDPVAAIEKGALTIRSHTDWYSDAEGLKGNEVAEKWIAEEQRALAAGFSGLRITGNVTFVTPETWPMFMEYEAIVSDALRGHRIVTLCTYRLAQCAPADVFDVARRHDCTLDHPDQGWQILTQETAGASPALKVSAP